MMMQELDNDIGSQAISAVIVDDHKALEATVHQAAGGTGTAPCTPRASAGGRVACSASVSAEPPAVPIQACEGEAAVMLPNSIPPECSRVCDRSVLRMHAS